MSVVAYIREPQIPKPINSEVLQSSSHFNIFHEI